MSCFFLSIDVCFSVMEVASFLKLLSQSDGFGCGIFVFGCFSQFLNLVFLCCLLVLGVKFLSSEGTTSLFAQFLEKINRTFQKIECFDSSDREHKDCKNSNNNGFVFSNSNLVDGLDQKKPIILHWSINSVNGLNLRKKTNKSCKNCDLLIPYDGIDLSKNRDSTASLPETEFDEKNNTHDEKEESEDEESRSRSDEYDMFDVITLRKVVQREKERGDCMELELEKERRAAKSAAEEAMAMLLKLRIEKSVVEMEAKQYKRVAEQKQAYDQEVIQSLQWMLRTLVDHHKIPH